MTLSLVYFLEDRQSYYSAGLVFSQKSFYFLTATTQAVARQASSVQNLLGTKIFFHFQSENPVQSELGLHAEEAAGEGHCL